MRLLAAPFRWHLAGLAAVWIGVGLLSSLEPAAGRAGGPKDLAGHGTRLEQWGTTLRQNRRELAELLGLPENPAGASSTPRGAASPAALPAVPRRSAIEGPDGRAAIGSLV